MLELTQFPILKTPRRKYYPHLTSQFINLILRYTNSSKKNKKIGFAHSIYDKVFPSCHQNSSSIFTAHLVILFQCLQTILQLLHPFHQQNYKFFSNSFLSLQSIFERLTTHALNLKIYTITLFSNFSPSLLKYIHLNPMSHWYPEKWTYWQGGQWATRNHKIKQYILSTEFDHTEHHSLPVDWTMERENSKFK